MRAVAGVSSAATSKRTTARGRVEGVAITFHPQVDDRHSAVLLTLVGISVPR
jgi:hypothetical protein